MKCTDAVQGFFLSRDQFMRGRLSFAKIFLHGKEYSSLRPTVVLFSQFRLKYIVGLLTKPCNSQNYKKRHFYIIL